jgi:hypothetical protein
MKYFFLLYLSFMSAACASLPDWILNPVSSDTHLYGVGEGATLKKSELAGLENLTGQLRTRIESNTQLNQQSVNDNFLQQLNHSVESSVEALPISDYKVEKRHQENNTIYTLVSVEKKSINSSLIREIESNTRQFNQLIEQRGSAGSELEWWLKNKKVITAQLADNFRYSDILGWLGHTGNLQPHTADLSSRITNLQNQNCIYVKPSTERTLYDALRIVIVNVDISPDNQKCDYVLSTTETVVNRKLFGKHTVTLAVRFNVDKQKRPLASAEKVTNATSLSSPEAAKAAAYQRLIREIRNNEMDLFESLFPSLKR